MTAPTATPHRANRTHIALLLLSFSAGAADAFAFLALGGIFTANMTGNLVLSGMFTSAEFGMTLVAALVAILAFAGVLYAAFRLTAAPAAAPAGGRRVLRRLILPSIGLQSLMVVLWAIVGEGGGLAARCAVLAVSASALALQTVGAKKLTDVDGVTTTYVTGTITTTMQELAEHRPGGQLVRVLSVLALPVGALCSTAALMLASPLGPVVAWASAVLAAVLLLPRGAHADSADHG